MRLRLETALAAGLLLFQGSNPPNPNGDAIKAAVNKYPVECQTIKKGDSILPNGMFERQWDYWRTPDNNYRIPPQFSTIIVDGIEIRRGPSRVSLNLPFERYRLREVFRGFNREGEPLGIVVYPDDVVCAIPVFTQDLTK